MMTSSISAKALRFCAALLCAGSVLVVAATAEAGSCPKDQVLTKPRPIEDAPDVGVGRGRSVLGEAPGDWRNRELLR